jgi:hypothetical protein
LNFDSFKEHYKKGRAARLVAFICALAVQCPAAATVDNTPRSQHTARCISSSARTATRCLVLLRACDKCSIMNMKGCSLLLFSGGVVAFAWDAAYGKSACVVFVAQIQV